MSRRVGFMGRVKQRLLLAQSDHYKYFNKRYKLIDFEAGRLRDSLKAEGPIHGSTGFNGG